MTEIGRIIAILDEGRLLLKSETSLSIQEQVVVFERSNLENSAFGLDHIDFPKGRLIVTAPQQNDIYLAERFRHAGSSRKRVSRPTGLAGLLGEDVFEDVPGAWSAALSGEDAMNPKWTNVVLVGDLIARG